MPALLAVPTRHDRDGYRSLRARRMADSLQVLALDVAQQASDQPGAPTGIADMAVALWDRHLKHHPADPKWADRDRFVLGDGLAPALYRALLHLAGYDLSIEALRGSERPGSRMRGRPEPVAVSVVEAGTGPRDHGLADAVGLALAERLLADEFNREGHDIVDHRTWVFVGDECLARDASREACALAAAWRLHKLVALYDDGYVAGATAESREDTPARFRARGWNVIGPVDGHDVDAIDAALRRAVDCRDAPSLVVCRTRSGGAAGRTDRASGHGDEASGAQGTHAVRERLDWRHPPFEIPGDAYESWNARERGETACRDWQRRFAAYQREFPELAAEFARRMRGDLPTGFHETLVSVMARFGRSRDTIATGDASARVLAALAPKLPELLGGSAEPGGSNLIRFPGVGTLRASAQGGRHVDYGVRASGMAAVMNGIALHGGYLPYGSACLAPCDGSGDAIRTAVQARRRVVHVFTALDDEAACATAGHAAGLQRIAGLDVWQPCDPAETAVAWIGAIARATQPSALLLSPRELPVRPRSPEQVLAIRRGGYVLDDRDDAVAVLLASGAEVALAIEAQQLLDARGVPARVVSMPSATVFERQDAAWRDAVLPPGLPRFEVDARIVGGDAMALADRVHAHAGVARAALPMQA